MIVKLYRVKEFLGEMNSGGSLFLIEHIQSEEVVKVKVGNKKVETIDFDGNKVLIDFYSDGSRVEVKNALIEYTNRDKSILHIVQYEKDFAGLQLRNEVQKQLLQCKVEALTRINNSYELSLDYAIKNSEYWHDRYLSTRKDLWEI